MPSVSVTIFASALGSYFLEDDGIFGNNISHVRFPDGTVTSFEHPTDDLSFSPGAAGINLTINFTDSLGASNFTTGNLTDPSQNPDSIAVRKLVNTRNGDDGGQPQHSGRRLVRCLPESLGRKTR